MELNHCPNFHIARSKFPEIRGLAYCTRVARAHCTTTPQVMHHRMALVEWYTCTKFRVASSKFPESKGAYACAKCTFIARALCTPSPNGMHHRITLIELHQCTKFDVDSFKFPKTGGPLSNKLVQSWRAQTAPRTNGNHKDWDSRHVTCKFGISGAHRLTCRGGKRTTGTKACAQCIQAPFFIRRQVGLAKVHPCAEFGVASSNFP